MPQTRLFPALLRQKVPRRLQRTKALQRAVAKAASSDSGSGKKGDGSSTKIVLEPAVATQSLAFQMCSKQQKTGSKILDTLRRDATYCLMGSSVFWRLGEEGSGTGCWRA